MIKNVSKGGNTREQNHCLISLRPQIEMDMTLRMTSHYYFRYFIQLLLTAFKVFSEILHKAIVIFSIIPTSVISEPPYGTIILCAHVLYA